MGARNPRHYLSYVREDLIASWKTQALMPESKLHHPSIKLRLDWLEKANHKRSELLGEQSERVWPWAFQLGRTLTAKSMKKGDVLWIVSRLSGLDREWPPSLIARLELAEDAWVSPATESEQKELPFPYHFGVALFTRPENGRFYAVNDATCALLETKYQTPLQPHPCTSDLPNKIENHVAAWDAASKGRFRSLRRLVNPDPLEALGEHLCTHSVFLSYRRGDHPEGSPERNKLGNLAERLIINNRTGVWFDILALPPSKHDHDHRRGVLKMILDTPLQEMPLFIARITYEYGGPSADFPKLDGYTLLEWQARRRSIVWKHSPSRHEARLREFPSDGDICISDISASELAVKICESLDTTKK